MNFIIKFSLMHSFFIDSNTYYYVVPSVKLKRFETTMKWTFSKGSGPMKNVGGIGESGEYYYVPSKKPNLVAPPAALGKKISLSIYPTNQVTSPISEENLKIYEFRYRQLMNDVGEGGVLGMIYYSAQPVGKLALVGVLTKIKKLIRSDDGGIMAVMQSIGRFYIKEVTSEKPYIKADVQIFYDYCDDNLKAIESLEIKLLHEVRYVIKLMILLYPEYSYQMNDAVLKYRPFVYAKDVRPAVLPGVSSELIRRSKFSFAVMDLIRMDAPKRLSVIQEPCMEDKYEKLLKVS